MSSKNETDALTDLWILFLTNEVLIVSQFKGISNKVITVPV